VWYCDACQEQFVSREDLTTCPHCGGTLRQEEDVLDTWFSSGLWPFSTLGWPDDTDDLRYFYPTSVLETGYDILFFWVARMIMLGLYLTGQEPFDTVYLHGLIRNEQGKKISKSMPDADRYDPLNIIAEYGQDALRFTLLTGSTPGNDMKLSLSRVEANRNFGNKIWQAARFVLGNLGENREAYVPPAEGLEPGGDMPLPDRWILSRYHRLVAEVTRLITSYQLGEAGRQIYEFLWGEYCDWYIEMTKPRLQAGGAGAESARRTLVYVLEGCLRLLHPYMPFVTEAIWQYLPHMGEALIIAPWPKGGSLDEEAETRVQGIMELIRSIRNARHEYQVEPGRRIAALVAAGDNLPTIEALRRELESLARIAPDRLTLVKALDRPPEKALTLVVPDYACYLPLEELVDLEAERARLTKELARLDGEIARAEKQLANPNFLTKAPPHVVEGARERLAQYRAQQARLNERLAALS